MAVSAVVGLVTAAGGAIAAGGIAAMTFFSLTGGAAFAAMFALGAGVSMLSTALIPKPDLGAQMRGITVTTTDPAGPRKLVYGKVRTGGNVVFIDHSGDDNKYLHLVVAFASHEIQGYDEIWFNDNKIWTSTGGFQSDWGTYVTIDNKLGTASQGASTALVNASSNWTDDHKLSGIAYIAFRLKWNRDKFPQGVPNITAVIRGKKVYDPRTEVFTYSQNPALCVRDYLLDSKYGLGEESGNINYTALAAAANLCEEKVGLSSGAVAAASINSGTLYEIVTVGTTDFTAIGASSNTVGVQFTATGSGTGTGTATSTFQDRYQCNGVIDTANQIKANIEQLLSCMGGRLTYSGGEYFIEGAEYRTPTVTIDESVIVSPIKTQTKQSRRSIYNSVKGTFLSEEKNYKVLDYPAQTLKTLAGSFETNKKYRILFVGDTDFTAIGASSNAVGVEFTATGAGSGTGYASAAAAEDGDLLYLDMPLPFVTNNFQAQRLAKIAARKSRQETVVSMTVNLTGLKIKIGDTIYLDYDKLGYDGKVFEVIGYKLVVSAGGEIGVQLECIETASDVYDWSSNDEEDFLSGGELDLYDGRTVDNVGTITHTPIGLKGPDGRLITSVDLSWPALTDAFLEFYIVTYEKDSDGNVFEFQTRENRLRIPELTIGSEYDFTVKAQNVIGVRSTGTTLNVPSLAGDTTAPAKPTSTGATGGVRQITAEWTNPTDDDFKHVEVYIAGTDSIPASPHGVVNGEEFVYTLASDESSTTTKYFWLKSVDYTGNKSDATASFPATSVVAESSDITDAITIKIDEIISPLDSGAVSASTETADSLVDGRVYEIQTVGTTDFTLVGASANAVGEIFTATNVDQGAGTGTVLPDDTATLQTALSSVSSSGLVLDGANKTYLITDDINVTGQFLRLKNFKFRFRKKYFYDNSLVNAGSFIVGRKYKIATLGTTVWTDIGYDDSDGTDPAAVGDSFTATGVGSGTGTANSDNWIDGRINCDAGSGTTKMTIELENIVVDGGRGTYKTGNEPWAVAVEDFFNYDSIQPDISASIKVNAFNVETDVRVTNCRFENIHSLAPIRVNSYGTTIIQDCVFKNMSFKSFEVFQSPDNGTTQKGRTLVSDVYAEDIGLLPDTYSVEAKNGTVSTKTFSDDPDAQTESPQGSFNFVCSFGEYNITNASVKNYGSCGVTADRNQIFNASNITITNDSTRSFSNNPSGAFWLEDCILANITNLHIDVTARAGIDTSALDNSLLQIYLTDGTKAFFNNVFVKAPTSTAYFNKLIRGSGQHKVNCNIQNFHVEGICRNLDDAVSFLLLPNSRVEQDIRLAHGYIAHGDIKIDNPHHATVDDVYLEGGYDSTINVTDLTLDADEIVNGTTYAIVSLGDTVWTDIGYDDSSGTDPAAVGDTFTANTSSATGTGTVIDTTILYEIVSIGTTDFTAMGTPSNTVGLRFKPSGGGTGTGTVSLVYGGVTIFRAANADAGTSQIPDETHDFNITNSYVYGNITNNTAITGTLSIINNKRIGSIASTSANNSGQTTVARNGLITGSVQITSDGADGTAKVEIANNPLIQNLVLVDTTNTLVISGNVTDRRIEVGDVQNFQVVGNTAKTDRAESCIAVNPSTASNILSGVISGNNCLIKTGTTGAGFVAVGSGVTNVAEGLNNKLTVAWS